VKNYDDDDDDCSEDDCSVMSMHESVELLSCSFAQLNLALYRPRRMVEECIQQASNYNDTNARRVTTCLENLEMSREFGTCQGNVRDVVNSQGNVREKYCHGKVSQNCSLLDEH